MATEPQSPDSVCDGSRLGDALGDSAGDGEVDVPDTGCSILRRRGPPIPSRPAATSAAYPRFAMLSRDQVSVLDLG